MVTALNIANVMMRSYGTVSAYGGWQTVSLWKGFLGFAGDRPFSDTRCNVRVSKIRVDRDGRAGHF